MERRFLPVDECPVSLEKRADGEEPKIVGRAAVFYDGTPETEYQLFSDLKERIMPRAFNKALNDRHDVRGLFNHDPNLVLGRTTAGTLKLAKSLRGLDYEIIPGDTTVARDVKEHIRRGDVTGSSFGFRVLEQKFVKDGDMDVREIHSVELLDVSPVTFPAYGATSTAVRSADDAKEARSAYDAWKAEQQQDKQRAAETARKLSEYQKRAQEVEL